jgi:hypothetical protein
MDLSEGIRVKVEKHGEKDIILDVMKSLQDDGVMITQRLRDRPCRVVFPGRQVRS